MGGGGAVQMTTLPNYSLPTFWYLGPPHLCIFLQWDLDFPCFVSVRSSMLIWAGLGSMRLVAVRIWGRWGEGVWNMALQTNCAHLHKNTVCLMISVFLYDFFDRVYTARVLDPAD